jgi:hypothetical protein
MRSSATVVRDPRRTTTDVDVVRLLSLPQPHHMGSERTKRQGRETESLCKRERLPIERRAPSSINAARPWRQGTTDTTTARW